MNNFQRKAEEMNMINKFKTEHKNEVNTKQNKNDLPSSETETNLKQDVSITIPKKEKNKFKKSYLTLYLPEKDIKNLRALAKAQGYTKISHFVQDLIEQLPN